MANESSFFYLGKNNDKILYEKFKSKLENKDLAGNSKLQKLLKIFDTDGNGILETSNTQTNNELRSVFSRLKELAGEDNILSDEEITSFLKKEGLDSEINVSDVQSFVKTLLSNDSTIATETGEEITLVDGVPVDSSKAESAKASKEEVEVEETDTQKTITIKSETGKTVIVEDKVNKTTSMFIYYPKIFGDKERLMSHTYVDNEGNSRTVSYEAISDKNYTWITLQPGENIAKIFNLTDAEKAIFLERNGKSVDSFFNPGDKVLIPKTIYADNPGLAKRKTKGEIDANIAEYRATLTDLEITTGATSFDQLTRELLLIEATQNPENINKFLDEIINQLDTNGTVKFNKEALNVKYNSTCYELLKAGGLTDIFYEYIYHDTKLERYQQMESLQNAYLADAFRALKGDGVIVPSKPKSVETLYEEIKGLSAMIEPDFYNGKLKRNYQEALNNYSGLIRMYYYVQERAMLCEFHNPKTAKEEEYIKKINEELVNIKGYLKIAIYKLNHLKEYCEEKDSKASDYTKSHFQDIISIPGIDDIAKEFSEFMQASSIETYKVKYSTSHRVDTRDLNNDSELEVFGTKENEGIDFSFSNFDFNDWSEDIKDQKNYRLPDDTTLLAYIGPILNLKNGNVEKHLQYGSALWVGATHSEYDMRRATLETALKEQGVTEADLRKPGNITIKVPVSFGVKQIFSLVDSAEERDAVMGEHFAEVAHADALESTAIKAYEELCTFYLTNFWASTSSERDKYLDQINKDNVYYFANFATNRNFDFIDHIFNEGGCFYKQSNNNKIINDIFRKLISVAKDAGVDKNYLNQIEDFINNGKKTISSYKQHMKWLTSLITVYHYEAEEINRSELLKQIDDRFSKDLKEAESNFKKIDEEYGGLVKYTSRLFDDNDESFADVRETLKTNRKEYNKLSEIYTKFKEATEAGNEAEANTQYEAFIKQYEVVAGVKFSPEAFEHLEGMRSDFIMAYSYDTTIKKINAIQIELNKDNKSYNDSLKFVAKQLGYTPEDLEMAIILNTFGGETSELAEKIAAGEDLTDEEIQALAEEQMILAEKHSAALGKEAMKFRGQNDAQKRDQLINFLETVQDTNTKLYSQSLGKYKDVNEFGFELEKAYDGVCKGVDGNNKILVDQLESRLSEVKNSVQTAIQIAVSVVIMFVCPYIAPMLASLAGALNAINTASRTLQIALKVLNTILSLSAQALQALNTLKQSGTVGRLIGGGLTSFSSSALTQLIVDEKVDWGAAFKAGGYGALGAGNSMIADKIFSNVILREGFETLLDVGESYVLETIAYKNGYGSGDFWMDVSMNTFYALLGGASGKIGRGTTTAYGSAGEVIGIRMMSGSNGKVIDFKGNVLETTSTYKNDAGKTCSVITKFDEQHNTTGRYEQIELEAGKTQTIEYDANNNKLSESVTVQGEGSNYTTTSKSFAQNGSEGNTTVTKRDGNFLTITTTAPDGKKCVQKYIIDSNGKNKLLSQEYFRPDSDKPVETTEFKEKDGAKTAIIKNENGDIVRTQTFKKNETGNDIIIEKLYPEGCKDINATPIAIKETRKLSNMTIVEETANGIKTKYNIEDNAEMGTRKITHLDESGKVIETDIIKFLEEGALLIKNIGDISIHSFVDKNGNVIPSVISKNNGDETYSYDLLDADGNVVANYKYDNSNPEESITVAIDGSARINTSKFSRAVVQQESSIVPKASLFDRIQAAQTKADVDALQKEIKAMDEGPQKKALKEQLKNKAGEIKQKDKTYESPELRHISLEADGTLMSDTSAPTKPTATSGVKSNIATSDDLAIIHKMDIENFEGRGYGIIEDFEGYKADLESQGIETHVLKNQEGKIIGYYQLEPAKDGELYIYSIGVPKELQATKSSYAALKAMQEEITNIAKELGVEKVTLDVENNPNLIKLYEKFGFVQKGKNEYGDIHMEAIVNKAIGNDPSKLIIANLKKTEASRSEAEIESDLRRLGFTDAEITELKENFPHLLTLKERQLPYYPDKNDFLAEVHQKTEEEAELELYFTQENFDKVKQKYNISSIKEAKEKLKEIFYEEKLKDFDPKIVEEYSSMTQIKKGQTTKLFETTEDLYFYLSAYKENPEITKYLLETTCRITSYYDEDDNRFLLKKPEYWRKYSGNEICQLVRHFKGNYEFLKRLSEMSTRANKKVEYQNNRFSAIEMIKINQAYKENPVLVNKLLNQTINPEHSSQLYSREAQDIVRIVEIYKENPESVENFINMTYTDKFGTVLPRFDATGIKNLIEVEKTNPELVEEYLNLHDEICKLNEYNNGYANELIALRDILQLKPELANEWLNGVKNGQLLFNIEDARKLCDLSDADYNLVREYIDFFAENIKSLKQADEEVTPTTVFSIICKNQKGLLVAHEIIGEAGVKHTLEMRFKGLKQFLENAQSLSLLSQTNLTLLKEKLATLPHPEQKISKIEILSAIANKGQYIVSEIITEIKSPKATAEQAQIAAQIFSTTKPYEEQIEDFIVAFNVPKERQDIIRKFLQEQKLNEKIITPPPIEAQIAAIEKRIEGTRNNPKIPEDKKVELIKNLTAEKERIQLEPEKYLMPKINDKALNLLNAQIESHINLPNQNAAFTKAVNEKVYQMMGVDVDSRIYETIAYDSKYISKMFAGLAEGSFKKNYKALIEMMNSAPDKKLTEIIMDSPENIATQKAFDAAGLDFDKWLHGDQVPKHDFTIEVKVEEMVTSEKSSLLLDLITLKDKSGINSAEVESLIQFIKTQGLENATIKDLPRIFDKIEEYFSTNEYCKNNNELALYLDKHAKSIHDIESAGNSNFELSVRLWDRNDVGRNIFFGNHVGCCTSVGSFNSFAAPEHLKDAFVNGIEIVDKSGVSFGNSMCFFAEIDGKLTFVIDSFEANGKLGSSPDVTNALIQFAQKLCIEMGRPNAQIMFGPNFNRLDFSNCKKTDNHQISVLGEAGKETYIDSMGGRSELNGSFKGSMYEIKKMPKIDYQPVKPEAPVETSTKVETDAVTSSLDGTAGISGIGIAPIKGVDSADISAKTNFGEASTVKTVPESPIKPESEGPVVKHLLEPGTDAAKEKIPVKGFESLVPKTSEETLASSNRALSYEIPNPNDPKKPLRFLTEEGEAIAWEIAEQLRTNALGAEDGIVEHFLEAGLATDETLSHRSKGEQSLHDKIRTFMVKNPDKTVADAIRSVKDAIGVRTVNVSQNVRNHPDIVELLEKGDYKSAINKAVELESEYVFNALKGIIDKMADGTAEFSLTRISNYMGEDGIPYFTDHQLFQLQDYALSKGIKIPVYSRVTEPGERTSIDNVYNEDGTTRIRESGYTALQMNFVTKDGDVFEWQYRGDKLNDFGEGEHIPYDLRTGKDIIGKDVILTDLYGPIKELLTAKDSEGELLFSKDLYKEYNAYLTAHYKYLREVELGFAEPGNPPKLPEGIDERLRAENLILIHNLGEGLKKGHITLDEALEQYELGLVRNNADNITDVSYRSNLDAIKKDANIDRHEAIKRLEGGKTSTEVDTELLVKTCMDSKCNIKNNLVVLIEDLRVKGISDEAILNYISRFKDENGVISDDIVQKLDDFIERFSSTKEINTGTLKLFSAVTTKDGTQVGNYAFIRKTVVNLIKTKQIAMSNLNLIQDITDFMAKNNITDPNIFEDLTSFCAELTNGYKKSPLTSKDFTEILNSLKDKNGQLCDTAMSLAVTLSKRPILKENIKNVILSAKNPETGKVEKHTFDFINQILEKIHSTNYTNPAGETQILQQALTAIKTPKIIDIQGKGTRIFVPDNDKIDTYLSLYETLPAASAENEVMKINKTSIILNACKRPDGKLSQEKLKLAEQMLKAKFTPGAISEVFRRSSDKTGELLKSNFKFFIINYKMLSNEDKNNLTSINLSLENGALRQTMTFKNGSTRVFDIDNSKVFNKDEYEVSTKTAQLTVGTKKTLFGEMEIKRNFLYTKIKDAVRGKSTKTKSSKNGNESEITILYDKNGNKIGSEYITREANGFIDVRFRDADGNTHLLSSSKKDADGNTIIEKEFPSLDGTVTKQSYKETPDGSTESVYIIKDANGNTLLEETRTFTRISNTHFTSSFNGKSYDIQIDELKVLTVTDDTGKKVRFDLHAFTNNKLKLFENILKQIPGHEFFNMAKAGLKGIDKTQITNNAFYSTDTNSINLGAEHFNFSTFMHEFGHNKDWKITENPRILLQNDTELNKIFAEEQKAFVEEFPTLQRDIIAYFISPDSVGERSRRGISETIAETNSILSTPYQQETIAFRKYYLQRYFPKTIAYIAKILNPDIYNP